MLRKQNIGIKIDLGMDANLNKVYLKKAHRECSSSDYYYAKDRTQQKDTGKIGLRQENRHSRIKKSIPHFWQGRSPTKASLSL